MRERPHVVDFLSLVMARAWIAALKVQLKIAASGPLQSFWFLLFLTLGISSQIHQAYLSTYVFRYIRRDLKIHIRVPTSKFSSVGEAPFSHCLDVLLPRQTEQSKDSCFPHISTLDWPLSPRHLGRLVPGLPQARLYQGAINKLKVADTTADIRIKRGNCIETKPAFR